MKMHRIILGVIMALMPLATLMATPSLVLHVPPQQQFANIEAWFCDINNPDDSTYHGLYLHGEISEQSKGLVSKTNTNTFDLPKGTKTVRLRDLQLKDQWAAQGYEVFKLRTGSVPEGDYYYGLTLLPVGVGDSGRTSVRQPGAIRLLPVTGKASPRFAWVGPTSLPAGSVTYDLSVVPLLEGQTPEEAVKSSRPLYSKTGILTEFLDYPVSAPPLPESGRFCYTVTASVNRRALVTSEVGAFTYKGGVVLALVKCEKWECPRDPSHRWECTDPLCPECPAKGVECKSWKCGPHDHRWKCQSDQCPNCAKAGNTVTGETVCTNWQCPACKHKWRCASSKCPKCACALWKCSGCGHQWNCQDNRCPKCHPKGKIREKITCHDCGQNFDGLDPFRKHECPKKK